MGMLEKSRRAAQLEKEKDEENPQIRTFRQYLDKGKRVIERAIVLGKSAIKSMEPVERRDAAGQLIKDDDGNIIVDDPHKADREEMEKKVSALESIKLPTL